jgi:hypothetical protein
MSYGLDKNMNFNKERERSDSLRAFDLMDRWGLSPEEIIYWQDMLCVVGQTRPI